MSNQTRYARWALPVILGALSACGVHGNLGPMHAGGGVAASSTPVNTRDAKVPSSDTTKPVAHNADTPAIATR
jgi:hypothetical protein